MAIRLVEMIKYEDPDFIDFMATLHAAADSIQRGADADAIALDLFDALSARDLDDLDEKARGLGTLCPMGAFAALCLALNAISCSSKKFLPAGGWNSNGVRDMRTEIAMLRKDLAELSAALKSSTERTSS